MTSTTFAGWGIRGVGPTMSLTYSTSRHPPQAAEMRSNSAFTQRRAAPMPRVWETVSERVWRVPKPTSRVMSARMRSAETAATMAWMRGSEACGAAGTAALAGCAAGPWVVGAWRAGAPAGGAGRGAGVRGGFCAARGAARRHAAAAQTEAPRIAEVRAGARMTMRAGAEACIAISRGPDGSLDRGDRGRGESTRGRGGREGAGDTAELDAGPGKPYMGPHTHRSRLLPFRRGR